MNLNSVQVRAAVARRGGERRSGGEFLGNVSARSRIEGFHTHPRPMPHDEPTMDIPRIRGSTGASWGGAFVVDLG